MIESDFTIPPADASPESVAAFDLRCRAYAAARAAYASIPLAIDRPAWDHLGAETRATMAAAVLAEICEQGQAVGIGARSTASAPAP